MSRVIITDDVSIRERSSIRPNLPFLPIDQSLVVADWSAETLGTGSVSSWTDFVNGNVVSQSTGDNQPTKIDGATPSGKPAVRFDGSNDFLQLASFDLSAHQDIDTWIVTVRSATSILQNIVDFDGAVRTLFASRGFDDNPRVNTIGNVGNDLEFHNDATLMNVWRAYNARHIVSSTGDDARGHFNKALTRFDSSGTSSDNTDPNLGSGELTFGQRASSAGSGKNYNGDIARIIYVQTSADRTAIAEFLSDYYGTP